MLGMTISPAYAITVGEATCLPLKRYVPNKREGGMQGVALMIYTCGDDIQCFALVICTLRVMIYNLRLIIVGATIGCPSEKGCRGVIPYK